MLVGGDGIEVSVDDIAGVTADGEAAGLALDAVVSSIELLPADHPNRRLLAELTAQLPSLTAASGNRSAMLHSGVPIDAIVTLATINLKGGPYVGPVADLEGATVSASPVHYDTDGDPTETTGPNARAWTIDFNGNRKIDRLFMGDGMSEQIELVLPWMGTEWAAKPLYPLSRPGFSIFESNAPSPGTPTGTVSLAETETTKLLIQFSASVSEETVLQGLNLRSKSLPSNIRVSIGSEPPFFVHPQVLSGAILVPDFSAQVNTYVESMRESGVTDPIPVLVSIATDVPGVVTAEAPVLHYDRTASGLFGSAAARTFEFPVQGNERAAMQFEADSSATWRLKRLRFAVQSDFQRWQTHPRETGVSDDRRSARVLPDLNVAQSFTMDASEPLVGVAVRLQVEAGADLLVELYVDSNDAPGGVQLGSQSLSVSPSADGSAQWYFVELSDVLDLTANKRYWCVLKASTGVVGWVLDPGTPLTGLLRFDRDGVGWRPMPGPGASLSAQLRLLRAPSVTESPDPISVEIPTASVPPRVELSATELVVELASPSDASSGLSLTPSGGTVSIDMTINAHARGELTLSGIEAQYQPL